MTAAADELIVTQPTVSSAIAALQREVGCALFERAGRGIRLTKAGTAFRPYAEDVLGLLEGGPRAAREAAELTERRLEIAAVTTAAESFVPGVMRSFSDRHPDVELALVVGNRQDVLDRVLSHRADVAIAGTPPTEERLLVEAFLDNEIACIAAAEDPAGGGEPVAAAALAGRVWLLREEGSGTRALNEQFLAARGLRPKTLTLGSNGAIKQAAHAGLGVSLLSRVAAAPELDAGRLAEIPLQDGPDPRPWFVLRSAVGPQRAVVEAFVAFVRTGGTGWGSTSLER